MADSRPGFLTLIALGTGELVVKKGGEFMAANFKIFMRRKNSSLELKLTGDFDGNSACELLNVLGKDHDDFITLVIHTEGLKTIFPFGVDTFQNNLYLLKHRGLRLVFTGGNATTIAPERNKFFRISLR